MHLICSHCTTFFWVLIISIAKFLVTSCYVDAEENYVHNNHLLKSYELVYGVCCWPLFTFSIAESVKYAYSDCLCLEHWAHYWAYIITICCMIGDWNMHNLQPTALAFAFYVNFTGVVALSFTIFSVWSCNNWF